MEEEVAKAKDLIGRELELVLHMPPLQLVYDNFGNLLKSGWKENYD